MRTFNLTCEAVEATLPDYLDETLEPWVHTAIEEHLAECARCTALAHELRNISREAAALPALLPERDVWSRIAGRIGAPVIESELVAESPPITPTTEPIVLASDVSAPTDEPPVSTDESLVLAEEPPVPAEELLVLTEEPVVVAEDPAVPAEDALAVTVEAPQPTDQLSLPMSEPMEPVSEPDVPTRIAPVPATPRTRALPELREKPWGSRWVGLAAAALVLVSAGTTFLLTARWLGPARTANVASGAESRTRSSSEKRPAEPEIRGRAASEQVGASSILTPPPDQLGSALTVSATSPLPVTPSPEEVVYHKEIKSLQKIVRRQNAELDASTVTEIEKNLRSLDAAIGQIRAALQKDPGSSLLDGQASRALEMKVELLRRAAMLRSST